MGCNRRGHTRRNIGPIGVVPEKLTANTNIVIGTTPKVGNIIENANFKINEGDIITITINGESYSFDIEKGTYLAFYFMPQGSGPSILYYKCSEYGANYLRIDSIENWTMGNITSFDMTINGMQIKLRQS